MRLTYAARGLAEIWALVRSRFASASFSVTPPPRETESGPNVGFHETLRFEVLDEIVIEACDLPSPC